MSMPEISVGKQDLRVKKIQRRNIIFKMEHLDRFCSLEYFVGESHRFPRPQHNKLIVLPEKCTRRSLAPLMVSKSRSGEACRQEEVRFVSALQHGRNIRGKRRREKKWHEGDGRTVETTVINLDVITYR